MSSTELYERNLRLLTVYVAGLHSLAWIPVFFLYMASKVSVEQVFLLEAVYYLTVVLAEVPSGYFSDAVGRCTTLRVAAASLTAAYLLFWIAPGFLALAVAEALLAVGFAFNSGTDAALHFDSLEALGRVEEFASRESRLVRIDLTATALAAVAGGAVAALSLGFAYLLSAVLSATALVAALRFAEPPRHRTGHAGGARGFLVAVRGCVGSLRTPSLAWLFGFGVLMTVLNHVPYELIQPYIKSSLNSSSTVAGSAFGNVTLWTGAHAAAAGLLGATLATRGVSLQRRWGTGAALVATTALQVAVIGLMTAQARVAVVPLLLLRVAPRALMTAPYRNAALQRLPALRRATWLSVQSLAGRLAFALFLGVASLRTGIAGGASPVVGPARIALVIGILGAGVLMATRRWPDLPSAGARPGNRPEGR